MESSTDLQDVDNYQFIDKVFQGLVGSEEVVGVCAFTNSPDHQRGWPIHHPFNQPVAPLIESGGGNTYFCISSVKNQKKLSRAQGDLCRTFVIPLDDIGEGVGAKYTPDQVPLEPSYIIETSPDNYQYGYLPDEPIEDIGVARALLKLITNEVGDSGAPIAGKLIRLPWGVNNKEKYGGNFECRLTLWEPDRRYTVEELTEAFSISTDELIQTAEKLQPVSSEAAPSAQMKQLELTGDDLFEWLIYQNMVHNTEPSNRGFFEIECPWAHEHTGDAAAAQFSPKGCGGPTYARSRQFNCFHAHCAERDASDLLRWMYESGRFVYCSTAQGSFVYDKLRPHIAISEATFHRQELPNHYYRDNKMRYMSKEWMHSFAREEVRGEVFRPGEPVIVKDPLHGPMFNTFVEYRDRYTPTNDESKILPFLQHLRYLFGSEYHNALSFLGYSVVRPEVRIMFALLHVSPEHGTGRGWLKELLYRLFGGERYVPAVTFTRYMEGEFNEWLRTSLVATFDEVYNPTQKYRVSDKLRELITERVQEVNIKHGAKFTTRVCTNLVFLSNHLGALQIPDKDRRIWAVVGDQAPKPERWYNKIYDLLDDFEAINQLYWHLARHIETHEFNPVGRAPETEWRKSVQLEGEDEFFETPIREVLTALREQGAIFIWRRHFEDLCRKDGARLPVHGVGGNSREWYRFNAVLGEFNVAKAGRHRASKRLRQLYSGVGEKDMIYKIRRPPPGAAPVKRANRLLEDLYSPEVTDRGPDGKILPIPRKDLFRESDPGVETD